MKAWRDLPGRLAADGGQVLVTVAAARGSTPREAGAAMLVGPHDSCDTIGGGRLEWEAIAHARAMLAAQAAAPELRRFPLAASLGQCCGGVVWLLFERIDAAAQAPWRERIAALEEGRLLVRECAAGSASRWHFEDRHGRAGDDSALGEAATPALTGPEAVAPDAWTFRHAVALPRFPVVIFGAGHVGEAIVRALLPLEARIRWIDTREDVFPPDLRARADCRASDDPVAELDGVAPGSLVLVLTHSHVIDLELCAAGLRHDDLAFFGLIGSRAKRARFEQRLVSRGVDPLRLARLVCPLGVPGIRSKLPAAIAVAVVAQLLQVREQGRAAPAASAPNEETTTATDIPC